MSTSLTLIAAGDVTHGRYPAKLAHYAAQMIYAAAFDYYGKQTVTLILFG